MLVETFSYGVRSVMKLFNKNNRRLSSPKLDDDLSLLDFYFAGAKCLEDFNVYFQLHEYLYTHFSPPHAKELEQSCIALIGELYENKLISMDGLSMIVQDFYSAISDRAFVFGPTTPEFTLNDFLEKVESFVCVRAHGILFGTQSDEEVMDLSLQERIRSLYWVTQGFLETALDFESGTVEELLNDAMAEIADMNSHKEIKKKFDCLLRCSNKISEAIRDSTKAPASADEFLPALIYVILKANPTLMQSNLSFILRFSMPFRTCSGETGYEFTNLCCVIRFIQEMNADSLRMPKDVFMDFIERFTPQKIAACQTL